MNLPTPSKDSESTDILALVRRRAANNMWSNHRLHAACSSLTDADFRAKRTAFFPSIHATLNHILIVDWYYLDALEGGGKGRSVFDDELPMKTMAALAQAQRAADERLVAFTRGLSANEALSGRVEMPRRDRVQRDSVLNVLSHLDVHQIHHRGQVHAMLSGTPVAPPQLDEFFMVEELPLRREELEALGLPIE